MQTKKETQFLNMMSDWYKIKQELTILNKMNDEYKKKFKRILNELDKNRISLKGYEIYKTKSTREIVKKSDLPLYLQKQYASKIQVELINVRKEKK